ncbi:GxxExxY protein [Chryseobacterium koreense]|nr:GxxExxY protein [Chryseobacterium koreense]MBB5333925.1 GxxExxY protein [Chryseobacterium koreense]
MKINFYFYRKIEMTENELSYAIIGAALEVHRTLGVGLLESAYEAALLYELEKLGFQVRTQVYQPTIYKETQIDKAYRIDMIVEEKVIVENKSVHEIHPTDFLRTKTYLKLSGIKLGLIINFNSALLKNGIHRVVNNL